MKFRHAIAAGIVALAVAVPASADVGPYFGVKGGLMDADASGHDKALAAGGMFGYRFFDDYRGSGALEAEGMAPPLATSALGGPDRGRLR